MERRTLYSYLSILEKEKTEGKSIYYSYDRTKFVSIETEEDAYWLGFITADGCIVEGKWLSIRLGARDREHLEKFCKYIGYSKEDMKKVIKEVFGGAYTKDNLCVDLKVCSLEIISNLMDKGVKPRKSGKEKPYKCSTLDLEKAYIRGLIDGDGYIRSTQYGFGLVGSYDVCKYVYDFINEHITNISNNHIREHGVIYKLEINGKLQVAKILKALYENSNIYLTRKFELYQNNYITSE